MENLIPIGRFSKMTRLSVKALRLYDEIGLLSPSVVDPSSGYRYYRRYQANRAEAIRILRAVDMPLEEIRAVVDEPDLDLAREHLRSHRDRLARQLVDRERMLHFLEGLIEREEGVMPYEVTVKSIPDRPVAAVRRHTGLSRIGADIGEGFATLMESVGRSGAQPAGPPLIVYHDVIDEQTEGDIEICFPVAGTVPSDGEVYTTVLTGGSVATTIHRGPYDQIGPAYHTLSGWIQEHGHEMAGAPREIYLNDPQSVPPEELLTEIEWPIR